MAYYICETSSNSRDHGPGPSIPLTCYERASTKLSDISDKATDWENAEDDKKNLVDASVINGAVLEAIDCIDPLVVEWLISNKERRCRRLTAVTEIGSRVG